MKIGNFVRVDRRDGESWHGKIIAVPDGDYCNVMDTKKWEHIVSKAMVTVLTKKKEVPSG